MSVTRLVDGLVRCIKGEKIARRELTFFEKFMEGSTPNKEDMANTIVAVQTGSRGNLGRTAFNNLLAIVADEERRGPNPNEVGCPDPHQGMYDLAKIAGIKAGIERPAWHRLRDLAEKRLALFGKELVIDDVAAIPSGNIWLPGMRSNYTPTRYARSLVRAEIRSRQPGFEGLKPRGTGGRPSALEKLYPFNQLDGTTGLWGGPAWGWRLLLDGLSDEAEKRILTGPLSPSVGPPPRLRLPLTVYRWDIGRSSGLLAYFDRPDNIAPFVVRGSESARQDAEDRDEDIASAVRVTWGAPIEDDVDVIHSWERDPIPPPPHASVALCLPGVPT